MTGQRNRPRSLGDTLKEVWRCLWHCRIAVRQKFGGNRFTLPVFLMLLLCVVAPKAMLVAILIALVVGYRFHLER
ncbi:hypothetical protein ACFL26_00735 [Patescibacteria group bacterium]